MFVECAKDSFAEEVEVEATEATPGAATAAFREMNKKYQGKGYRFSFGAINEI